MSDWTKEKLKDLLLMQIDEKWIRLKWLVKQEEKFELKKTKYAARHATQLYFESSMCYLMGNYLATILSICSAIEVYLTLYISDNKINDRTYFSKYIKEATKEGIITEQTKKELLKYNRYVRNQVVHPKSTLFFGFLGLKAISKSDGVVTISDRSGEEESKSLSFQEAAEEGILLFYKVLHDSEIKQSVDEQIKERFLDKFEEPWKSMIRDSIEKEN